MRNMKARHIPVRMCAICRTRAPKNRLARHTLPAGQTEPVPDERYTAPGRGIYLCGEERCRKAFSQRYAKKKAKRQEV